MTGHDFKRFNALADKAITDTATINELKEFNQLLTQWNESVEFNLFKGHNSLQPLPQKNYSNKIRMIASI